MTLSRLVRVKKYLLEQKIDAILVSNLLNVRYLSGYTGSSARLLITPDDAYIITDSRYEMQVCIECADYTLVLIDGQWETTAVALIKDLSLKIVVFEGDSLSYSEWYSISSALQDTKVLPADNYIAKMRLVKDDDEINLIRKAAHIVDATYAEITSFICDGITEQELSVEIDCELRRNGAVKEGADTIAISGPRSALIHGKATDRIIRKGDLVLMDFSANYEGYHSDITRTVLIGEPDSRQEEIYSIVLEAQKLAINMIKPGIAGYDVDAAARDYIIEHGYGDYFSHGLGHGLGLHIHDSPAFSRYSKLILEKGIVATVEPGIYIPEWGGIRLEDDILVTDSGCEILTAAPKSIRLY
ncbi:MAG: M24 family metallopeptidase [Armatimonadota bacterium]